MVCQKEKNHHDYDDNKSFYGAEREDSKQTQLQTNWPSISSGLVGDNVQVKNRYLLPVGSYYYFGCKWLYP